MSWREAKLVLQLEAEEHIGFLMRERARLAREIEDASYAAAVAGLEKKKP